LQCHESEAKYGYQVAHIDFVRSNSDEMHPCEIWESKITAPYNSLFTKQGYRQQVE
jgi:hypothetical protein